MKLRKDSWWKRRTVDQTGRIIIVPETHYDKDVSLCAVRRVTVIFQSEPQVVVAIGPSPDLPGDWESPGILEAYYSAMRNRGDLPGVDDSGSTPEDIASGRAYQWAEPDTGRGYTLHLRAQQWIAALAVSEIAKISVICEYLGEAQD